MLSRSELLGHRKHRHEEDVCVPGTKYKCYFKHVTVIRSRIMIWAGQIVCMVDMKNTHKLLVRNEEGTDQMEDLG
jgi:hypothetical protein